MLCCVCNRQKKTHIHRNLLWKKMSHGCRCWSDPRMDKDSSMTVDWGEFLQHVILNPVDNIGELVSSWKHSLVRSLLWWWNTLVKQMCIITMRHCPPSVLRNETVINVITHFVHSEVFDVGESRAMPIEFPDEATGLGEWKRFVLSAGLSDAVSRTLTAPIDRLKTQLQVSSIVNAAKKYCSILGRWAKVTFQVAELFTLRALIGCFQRVHSQFKPPSFTKKW